MVTAPEDEDPNLAQIRQWDRQSGLADAKAAAEIFESVPGIGMVGVGNLANAIDSSILARVDNAGLGNGSATAYAESLQSAAITGFEDGGVFDLDHLMIFHAMIYSEIHDGAFMGAALRNAYDDYIIDFTYESENQVWYANFEIFGIQMWDWEEDESFFYGIQVFAQPDEYHFLDEFETRSWGYIVTNDPHEKENVIRSTAQFVVAAVPDFNPDVAIELEEYEHVLIADNFQSRRLPCGVC